MFNLSDLINGTVELDEKVKHRAPTQTIARPEEKVTLTALDSECHDVIKTQKDPTPDLIELAKGPDAKLPNGVVIEDSYLVWCKDTEQTWFAPTEKCLNANFIYRDDLEIHRCFTSIDADAFIREKNKDLIPGVITRKLCYILDNPGNESYEVYYDSSYPSLHYGKSTPQGTFVYKYPNRFHRDMAILALDETYGAASSDAARKVASADLNEQQAIIVSDGAWLRNVCALSYVYIDAEEIRKVTISVKPSDVDQAVLIAEISGAYNALKECYNNGKTDILYYYDNTSILNVFKNRKTEYISEVKKYKELCKKLQNEGVNVNFVEIHPKTGENRDTENKALIFFHNMCDAECRNMATIASKKYKDNALAGNTDGKQLSDVSQQTKQKTKRPYNKQQQRR